MSNTDVKNFAAVLQFGQVGPGCGARGGVPVFSSTTHLAQRGS